MILKSLTIRAPEVVINYSWDFNKTEEE